MAVRRTAIFIFMCFYSKGTINRFFHFSFEKYVFCLAWLADSSGGDYTPA